MPLFYIEEGSIRDEEVHIGGALGHHLKYSLRCRPGETLQLVEPNRRKLMVMITRLRGSGIIGKIEREEPAPVERKIEILLCQALPKGKHFETVLQKSTELGVTSIVPLITERSVVRIPPERIPKNMVRWKKIVIEASQQAERWAPPLLDTPCSLADFLAHPPPFDIGLFLWEKERHQSLYEVVRKMDFEKKRVALIVGPEGGFSEKEAEGVVKAGFLPVSLGHRILRTETAGPFLVGLLQFEWGDFGRIFISP